MKRGFLLVALAIVGGLLPAAGHANEDANAPVVGECQMDGVKAAGTTCSGEFELREEHGKRFVSVKDTHADYHSMTTNAEGQAVSGGTGTNGRITMRWIDAAETLIAEYSCRTIALSSDYNPSGLTRLGFCDGGMKATTYAPGNQRIELVATELSGAPAGGIRLHGRLVIRKDGDLV